MIFRKVQKIALVALVVFSVLLGTPVLYVAWFVNQPAYHVLYTDDGLIVEFGPTASLFLWGIANYDFHTTASEFDLRTSEIADNCRPVDRVPADFDHRTRIVHPPSGLDLALGHDYGPRLIGWDEEQLDDSGQPTPVFSKEPLDNLVILNDRVCQSTHELIGRLKQAIRSEIERRGIARDGARIETVAAAIAEHCWNHFDDCRRRLLPNPASEDIN